MLSATSGHTGQKKITHFLQTLWKTLISAPLCTWITGQASGTPEGYTYFAQCQLQLGIVEKNIPHTHRTLPPKKSTTWQLPKFHHLHVIYCYQHFASIREETNVWVFSLRQEMKTKGTHSTVLKLPVCHCLAYRDHFVISLARLRPETWLRRRSEKAGRMIQISKSFCLANNIPHQKEII